MMMVMMATAAYTHTSMLAILPHAWSGERTGLKCARGPPVSAGQFCFSDVHPFNAFRL